MVLGFRASEAANVNIEHVKLTEQLIHVINGKGGKDLVLSLSAASCTCHFAIIIRTRWNGFLYFEINMTRDFSVRSIWQICNDSGRENGVHGLHPYV